MSDAIEKQAKSMLIQLTLQEKISLLSGKDIWNTQPIERLGIPSLRMTDGPHGVRASDPWTGRPVGPTTCFPTGVSMAASWNPELIFRMGEALGEETLGMECDILLGPCVNIMRTPLAGRNFEAYSEDPYLAGKIGVAFVNGVQSKGVGTSLKHYALNNQEIERGRGNSIADERTMREVYLAQFEMIVKEAKPWTVMCSYNRINGVYASQNDYLLNKILKEEWGYEGIVISDWGANHTIFESVQGGLDIEMPGPARYYGNLLEDAVLNWQIDPEVIDKAVLRILRTILKSGKMDNPKRFAAGSVNTQSHQDLARELATEAITLLKNDDNLLPIQPDKVKSIAVIGPNANEARIGGGGSSYVVPPHRSDPLSALKDALGSTVRISYEPGCNNYVSPPAINNHVLVLSEHKSKGALAEYFTDPEFRNLASTKVEDTIDHWFSGNPIDPFSDAKYSIRWTASLSVPLSGRYRIGINNTDCLRLYLDGKIVLENDIQREDIQKSHYMQSSQYIELDANKLHDFKVEFSKVTDQGWAQAKVEFMYDPIVDDRIAKAVQLANDSDLAIIFAGMPEGYETEGNDRPHMDLPGKQDELISAVAKANPNTIVVLNVGAPVTMPWVTQVKAIVCAYYPGMEAGKAIRDILLGIQNPCGKLPVTFPIRYQDNPTYINYPGFRDVMYGEGIFVGYRYYDKKEMDVLFPFGHGLSYTQFEYTNLLVPQAAIAGETVEATVDVRNIGVLPGKEVIQVYIHDKESTLARPEKELKGFSKISLEPGEMKTVKFSLNERSFAYYDPYQKKWTVEPGEYTILVGSSSRDIRLSKDIRLE